MAYPTYDKVRYLSMVQTVGTFSHDKFCEIAREVATDKDQTMRPGLLMQYVLIAVQRFGETDQLLDIIRLIKTRCAKQTLIDAGG